MNVAKKKEAMSVYFRAVCCHVILAAKIMVLQKAQGLLSNGPQFVHIGVFNRDGKSVSVSAIPVIV